MKSNISKIKSNIEKYFHITNDVNNSPSLKKIDLVKPKNIKLTSWESIPKIGVLIPIFLIVLFLAACSLLLLLGPENTIYNVLFCKNMALSISAQVPMSLDEFEAYILMKQESFYSMYSSANGVRVAYEYIPHNVVVDWYNVLLTNPHLWSTLDNDFKLVIEAYCRKQLAI